MRLTLRSYSDVEATNARLRAHLMMPVDLSTTQILALNNSDYEAYKARLRKTAAILAQIQERKKA